MYNIWGLKSENVLFILIGYWKLGKVFYKVGIIFLYCLFFFNENMEFILLIDGCID